MDVCGSVQVSSLTDSRPLGSTTCHNPALIVCSLDQLRFIRVCPPCLACPITELYTVQPNSDAVPSDDTFYSNAYQSVKFSAKFRMSADYIQNNTVIRV